MSDGAGPGFARGPLTRATGPVPVPTAPHRHEDDFFHVWLPVGRKTPLLTSCVSRFFRM